MIATIDDGEWEPGFGVGIDEDGKHRWKVKFGTVIFTDGHPFAGGGFGYAFHGSFDIRRHHLPFAGVFIEHDMTFGLEIASPFAVASKRHFHAINIFGWA